MHASHEFAMEHPEVFQDWYLNSNYLAFLSVKNEHELISLFNKGKDLGIKCSLFREPNLANQVTAVAFEPCKKTRSICGNLPLALKSS